MYVTILHCNIYNPDDCEGWSIRHSCSVCHEPTCDFPLVLKDEVFSAVIIRASRLVILLPGRSNEYATLVLANISTSWLILKKTTLQNCTTNKLCQRLPFLK